MRRFRLFAALCAALCVSVAHAGNDDFGLWLGAGVDKKINKKAGVELEVDFRTRNDLKTVDRWSGGISFDYKITKWLKADAGYSLLYDNRQEKISYNYDADGNIDFYNNWRPSYWALRHRFNVSFTGEVKWGRFNFSLRERWQYTYRPQKTTERYDFDNLKWEDTDVSGKGKNLLRSRLQVEYSKKKAKLKPFVNAEIFNGMALEKARFTIGTDVKITKKHSFEVFYRYQVTNDKEDDNEPNCHYLGAGYKFKF